MLIPALTYQTSPIATIPPSHFADLFNSHLLLPVITVQGLLPLLDQRLGPVVEKASRPKLLVFTPSIISSINPPFHAPEATVCSALTAFTEVLAAELRPLSIPVTHVQLGTFDLSGFMPARHQMDDACMLASRWSESARMAYGRNFLMQHEVTISGGRIQGMKGSSLRHLHNTVFDVVDGSVTATTLRVGLGSSLYGFVGRWVPRSLITWMMGIRRVDELSTWQKDSADVSQASVGTDESERPRNDTIAIPPDSRIMGNVRTEL